MPNHPPDPIAPSTPHRRPLQWPGPLAGVALTVLALLALSVPRAQAQEMTLRAIDGQRYRAMVQGDLEALEGFLDEDLVYTHSHGGVDDKASFLESLENGRLAYRRVQLGSSAVKVWNNAAVITGAAVLEVEADGDLITAPVRFTAVYRHGTDQRWRLLAWQTTPTAPPTVEPLPEPEPASGGGGDAGDAGTPGKAGKEGTTGGR